jgi:protein AaeX
MVEELDIFGVFLPAALAWAVLAIVLTYVLRGPLQRLPLDRFLWQPSLLELAVFIVVWWGLTLLADNFPSR